MTFKSLSHADKSYFDEHGFVIIKQLFTAAEINLLNLAAKSDPTLASKGMQLKDTSGGIVNLALWNDPGDDLFGMLVRCERIVKGMALLLGGEVYHYHSKLNAKMPHTQGKWEWHQDYGYWYDNGILFPHLASVMVALDKATPENGCLQVLRGSHLAGRVEHGSTAHQMGANLERVEQLKQTCEHVNVELEPGDAVFFHCNTLHCSGDNQANYSRYTIISSFNRADNSSYKAHQHPNYTPLKMVKNEALLDVGLTGFGSGRHFFPQPTDF